MGLRQFNEDVATAKLQQWPGVSNIRKGDSDGEFAFTFSNEALQRPLELQVLTPDVDSYPERSSFMIFTLSVLDNTITSDFIEALQSQLRNKTVQQAIQTLCERLISRLTSDVAESLDGTASVEELEEDADDDSGFDEDHFYTIEIDDEDFGNRMPLSPSSRRATSAARLSVTEMQMLKQDLKRAQDAGFSLGVYKDNQGQLMGLFSLSLPASMLGVPEDVLEAWNISHREHVVLLCRAVRGYCTLDDFLSHPSTTDRQMVFRFGQCPTAKPSLHAAKSAFGDDGFEHGSDEGDTLPDSGHTDFVSIPMSGSIESLLNEKLCTLIKERKKTGWSWDEAIEEIFRRSRNLSARAEHDGPDKQDGSFLSQDRFQQDDDLSNKQQLSLPLIAMRLAIRQLVYCTHYCMVCHRKTTGGSEAVKPYVCSDSLCLFQYLSLGFGASIEHEIMNHPYVVDLLISFFHAAVTSSRIREIPRGLNLRSVRTGLSKEPAKHFPAKAKFDIGWFRLTRPDLVTEGWFKENEWVFVVIDQVDPTMSMATSQGGMERHMCRITDISHDNYKFEICATWTTPFNVMPNEERNQATHPSLDWINVLIFKYDVDIDDMPSIEQSQALTQITETIPPVLEMRDFLTHNPGIRLSACPGLSSSAFNLLRWIVASNRSYIVQESALNAPPYTDSSTKPHEEGSVRVEGLEPRATWMKFRFAQGSPEKEAQFCMALESQPRREEASALETPTLFAWHGSPIGNWHSIIRTGLDFQTVAHGRASGNGVYLSQLFSTSLGYTNAIIRNAPGATMNCWQNSHIRPTAAICVCEVVNRPDEFVSVNPHYVVDHEEWIQCRYLFVQVSPTHQSLLTPVTLLARRGIQGSIKQQPGRFLLGPSPKLLPVDVRLPILSTRRQLEWINRHLVDGLQEKQVNDVISQEQTHGAACFDRGDDVDALFAGNDADFMALSRKRTRSPSDDSMLGVSPLSKRSTGPCSLRTPSAEPLDWTPLTRMTNFSPGTLDYSSLPKLPEPTWKASSSMALRRLNIEIRDLQKSQKESRQLSSLGWYIDLEQLHNAFHWIVELHSFDLDLPLAQDMERAGCQSIVLEIRFGSNYPITPPFVRVIRPRFVPFLQGGGGHVTAGGAICTELLTNTGWSSALSMDKVFLQVRLGLCDLDPAARLESGTNSDYNMFEAVAAYERAATSHGWSIPADLQEYTRSWQTGVST